MGNVLIIDDNPTTCELLKRIIIKIGYDAEYHQTLQDGLVAVRNGSFDVVFLDVLMPDGSGLDHIHEIQSQESSPEVIIITGTGSKDGAEIAIKNGAWDYLQKPLSPERIHLPIKRVLEYRKNTKNSAKQAIFLKRKRIIGTSEILASALEELARAANNDSNVLITGETGTGKEVFARTLHENSDRSSHPLIVVDCAALPENLIESTLFGHLKGAFTGADRAADGLVKMADQGTLFLDEIGELSLLLQKSLLRVIQEKTFRPVGSIREYHSDFRLIAATNRNLEAMVSEGTFRQDLYFRLRSQLISIPPLRDRHQDVAQLVIHHSRLLTEKNQLKPKGFSPDFIETLEAYEWPGNIRELVHTIEQAVYTSQEDPILFPKHLSEELRVRIIDSRLSTVKTTSTKHTPPSPSQMSEELSESTTFPSYRQYRERVIEESEKIYLEKLMALSGGKVKRAMALANLGRTRLYNLLKKHSMSK